ncbi:MAG TPA: hypothetical protein VD994_15580 [Prosthecobacter sp.]|nr:hypothetical protein [Prosthecobacter sp.]
MKKLSIIFSVAALGLTQCVGPDGRPMSPFGPLPPAPYSEQREQYRSEAQEYARNQSLEAYNRGYQDGSRDHRAGEARSYLRHAQNYDESTRAAYQEGYDKGYGTGPLPGSGAAPTGTGDPAYSQGYDYGLRDRVGGRPADADAYAGSYDPRYRRSFERGYYDAYESRRGQ